MSGIIPKWLKDMTAVNWSGFQRQPPKELDIKPVNSSDMNSGKTTLGKAGRMVIGDVLTVVSIALIMPVISLFL